MASISSDAKGNKLVKFRYGKREFTKSANTKDQKVAESAKSLVEDTMMRLNRGWLTMPEGADPGEFIMSGGKRTSKAVVGDTPTRPKPITLGELFRLYDENFPRGAKADTTIQTEGYHKVHLLRVFLSETAVDSLALADVQHYANKRSQETWRDKPITPPTILKELATFRFIWNWGRKQGHVLAPLPYQDKDLNFARTEQKPPFQTYDAIIKTISRNGVNDDEVAALWESLYLSLEEVHEALEHVGTVAKHPFIYPMFVFTAMTGARRSEICRSRIEDWDFESLTVNIREKKRKRGRSTFRVVDINSVLLGVMKPWLESLSGQFTISKEGEPLTVKMATDHFKRTLASHPKWKNLPGFHTFRHSFASILASKGVDEPTIDKWMGHQTAEQRERYRHLFPKGLKRSIEMLTLGPGQ